MKKKKQKCARFGICRRRFFRSTGGQVKLGVREHGLRERLVLELDRGRVADARPEPARLAGGRALLAAGPVDDAALALLDGPLTAAGLVRGREVPKVRRQLGEFVRVVVDRALVVRPVVRHGPLFDQARVHERRVRDRERVRLRQVPERLAAKTFLAVAVRDERLAAGHEAVRALDALLAAEMREVAVVAVRDLGHAAVAVEEARAVLDLIRRGAVLSGIHHGATVRIQPMPVQHRAYIAEKSALQRPKHVMRRTRHVNL